MPMSTQEFTALVDQIRPMLAGKSPELQGAVLADLVAIFLAGHHSSVRDTIFQMHIESVRNLIPVNVKIFGPEGWE